MRRPRGEGLARRLVRACLRADDADRLLADLAEEHRAYDRTDLWYWRQVLASIHAIRRAHRRRSRGPRHLLETTAQDVRFAVRQLVHTPRFALPAVLVLALGIGATTAIFSVIDTVLLRPLPYDESARIVRAWAHLDDGTLPDFSFRVPELRAFDRLGDVFEAVGGEFPTDFTAVDVDGEPVRLRGRRVSAGLFDVFGVAPALGRLITPAEEADGEAAVALVSHSFWRRHLGTDPAALGGTLELDGHPFRLIGVLPRDYRHVSGDVDVFVPYSLGTSRWTGRWLDIYGRLRQGITPSLAAERLGATMRAVAERNGRTPEWHATVEGLHEMVVGDYRRALWSTFAVVGLVLLIACLNVANLCLVRVATRAPEISVRRALGAGRVRVARQLMAENLVLGLTGGALGTLLALVGIRLIVRLAPAAMPRVADVALDASVLGFSGALTIGTVLAFGLVPTLGASGEGSQPSATTGGGRGRATLVVVEVAVAIVLLVGAGLLVRTLQALRSEELGFDRSGAVSFRVLPSSSRYSAGQEVFDFHRVLRDRLRRLPEVVAVGAGSDLPVSGPGAVANVNSESRVRAGLSESVNALQRRAAVGYFEALRIPILEGRSFDESDSADGERVTIVNASLARRFFPGRSAIGERVGFGDEPGDNEWMTIVGVAADVRFEDVDVTPEPQIYQVHAQSTTREMAYVVRGDAPPDRLIAGARQVLRDLDPQVPLYAARPLQALVDDALATHRFTAVLYGLFAAIALVLTVAGVSGVLAYVIHERRREVAVRVATGARPADIMTLMTWRGMRLVLLGFLLGLPGAWAATSLSRSLLYGVAPGDPITYGSVGLLLGLVALAACWMPARRAARQDPMPTLRGE